MSGWQISMSVVTELY